MTTIIAYKKEPQTNAGIEELQVKSMILDDLMEFIEDKYFGYLMALTEKEPNISLSKAKKLMR